MEPRSTFLGTLFGSALLIALVAGAYLLLSYVGDVFAALPPQVETLAVIASLSPCFAAVIIAEGLKAGRMVLEPSRARSALSLMTGFRSAGLERASGGGARPAW